MNDLDRRAGGVAPELWEGGFCRCDGPMPVPDTTGASPVGSMCFGCDKPMDEDSCAGLYEPSAAEDYAALDRGEWPFDDDPPDPL